MGWKHVSRALPVGLALVLGVALLPAAAQENTLESHAARGDVAQVQALLKRDPSATAKRFEKGRTT
ncbi:MAG: hypothetical protein ACRD2D_02645, partial [Terriglobales bacterium]